MGHSSGAHISLLMIVERAIRRFRRLHDDRRDHDAAAAAEYDEDPFRIDSYVGISGVYDIGHHFDYEAARGVEG